MRSYEYVAVGLVLCVLGIIPVIWWLIRTYNDIISENHDLKKYINVRDQEFLIGSSELVNQIQDLNDYIDDREREGWSAQYERSGENSTFVGDTQVLSGMQFGDVTRGRHVRPEVP